MSLIRYNAVTLDEALGVLSARTCSPSTMGAQLDVVEQGTKGSRIDPFEAQEKAENRIMRDISAIRCLDALAASRVRPDLLNLEQLQRITGERIGGRLVVQCLRAFEEWRNESQERALVAVYMWANGKTPVRFPIPKHQEVDLAQAFRAGKTPRAKSMAADLYADCYLVLAEWIPAWNLRQWARATAKGAA
jgi:hypothetical protein